MDVMNSDLHMCKRPAPPACPLSHNEGIQIDWSPLPNSHARTLKQWLRHYPGWKRLFLWTVVIVPVPLVLNEGTLRIFHWAG
jgi:hypothetical protein